MFCFPLAKTKELARIFSLRQRTSGGGGKMVLSLSLDFCECLFLKFPLLCQSYSRLENGLVLLKLSFGMGRWLYVSKSAAELVAESSRLSLSLSLSLSAAIFSEIRRSAKNFLFRLSSSNDGAGGPKFGNGSYGYGSNSAPWRDLVPRFCITQSSISIQCRVLRVLQYSDFAAADNEQRNPKSRSWSLGALQ